MFQVLVALLYLCFISLGLPDSILGAAWPVMQLEFDVPVSYAGLVSMTISVATVASSACSGWLSRKLGAGKLTAFSIVLTALALFGFSVSSRYWMLLLWALPYGFGAGAVDSSLNNYTAIHFKAQHMSWLHCSWGVGASIGPSIMTYALLRLDSWSAGYRIVGLIQLALSLVVFLSLPLWKRQEVDSDTQQEAVSLSVGEIFRTPGAIPCFVTFFAYCALEASSSLWATSFFVQQKGIGPEDASSLASLFYYGLILGRAANGFLAMRIGDRTLIRAGSGIILAGVLLMLLPLPVGASMAGFIIVGLGCAPIYPCIIHMTPDLFGKARSQAMMGVQIAFAYTGICIMPPFFGLLGRHISMGLLPWYILALWIVMTITHSMVVRLQKQREVQA